MPSDFGGDKDTLRSLLSGPWYTCGGTCLLSRWSRPTHLGGCCEESLSVVAAVIDVSSSLSHLKVARGEMVFAR